MAESSADMLVFNEVGGCKPESIFSTKRGDELSEGSVGVFSSAVKLLAGRILQISVDQPELRVRRFRIQAACT